MHVILVKYDQWHFAEVDPVCLKRLAIALRNQIIEKIPNSADKYDFYGVTLPLVEKAILGKIVDSLDLDAIPFISANYRHDKGEGVLPPEFDADFQKSVSEFTVAAQGMSLEQTTKILKDGMTYAWVDFEDEGDWPEKVKYK